MVPEATMLLLMYISKPKVITKVPIGHSSRVVSIPDNLGKNQLLNEPRRKDHNSSSTWSILLIHLPSNAGNGGDCNSTVNFLDRRPGAPTVIPASV